MDEKISSAFESVPDDFVLSNRKEGDTATSTLITEYNKVSSTKSNLPEVKEESTGKELKEALKLIPFEDKVRIAYLYMVESGRVTSDVEYDNKVKSFKLTAMKIGVYSLMILFIMLITGVVVAGIYRNEINSNEVTNYFMRLVNTLLNSFVGNKPVVD